MEVAERGRTDVESSSAATGAAAAVGTGTLRGAALDGRKAIATATTASTPTPVPVLTQLIVEARPRRPLWSPIAGAIRAPTAYATQTAERRRKTQMETVERGAGRMVEGQGGKQLPSPQRRQRLTRPQAATQTVDTQPWTCARLRRRTRPPRFHPVPFLCGALTCGSGGCPSHAQVPSYTPLHGWRTRPHLPPPVGRAEPGSGLPPRNVFLPSPARSP